MKKIVKRLRKKLNSLFRDLLCNIPTYFFVKRIVSWQLQTP